MRNLLLVHLESVSRQTLDAFAGAFPNVRALLARSVWFPDHFAAATSTLMALTYLWHGNDFELDHNAVFEGARQAHLNEHLFGLLARHGYASRALCLDAFHGMRETRVSVWPESLPPVFGTRDEAALLEAFDQAIARPPFAIYCWNMLSHIEHSGLFALEADSLTDQLHRAYAAADRMVGALLARLDARGRLEDTTVVLFGDHGDDFWTHGYKAGFLHGTEPTTDLTWTPLAILDARLAPAVSERLASSIDLYRTCLALLGIPPPAMFEPSGIDLFAAGNEVVFSQNYMASQPDAPDQNVTRAYAATNRTYTLIAGSRGLELYAWRLDPGNHCNLLHFLETAPDGSLRLRRLEPASQHFLAAMVLPPSSALSIVRNLESLREALARRIEAKHRHVAGRATPGAAAGAAPAAGEPAPALLDLECLRRFSARGRADFYFEAEAGAVAPRTAPAAAAGARLRFF